MAFAPFSSNIRPMRGTLFTLMALLLVLTNTLMLADVHAEAFSGRHLSEPALHVDGHCDPDEEHAGCHHCCHAQAHFYSLPQSVQDDWYAPGRDWSVPAVVSPHLSGRAPPVPPPKA